jgi:hypothetical protein
MPFRGSRVGIFALVQFYGQWLRSHANEVLGIKSFFFPLAAAVGVVLTGCSTGATYLKAPSTGHFSGEPRMVAIAPNTFFFFQPDTDPPFTFTTHKKGDPDVARKGGRGNYAKEEWTIRPEEMITTGASIPRRLWYLRGFAAFDYIRASLIHDWLYEAHHRYEIAKGGYKAAMIRGDRQAALRNQAEMNHYREYADIRQEDAADIFAECIKIAMLEADEISNAYERSSVEHPAETANLADLKTAFRTNRPNRRVLWLYHYFVSPDCVVKASMKLWNKTHSDLEIYRVLTSPGVVKRAEEKGYLSPWLVRRFKQILKREKQRDEDLQHAINQGVAQAQSVEN